MRSSSFSDSNLFKKELGAVIVELKQIISNKDKYVAYKNIPEMIYTFELI